MKNAIPCGNLNPKIADYVARKLIEISKSFVKIYDKHILNHTQDSIENSGKEKKVLYGNITDPH